MVTHFFSLIVAMDAEQLSPTPLSWFLCLRSRPLGAHARSLASPTSNFSRACAHREASG
jgi:hypothetical protein